MKIHWITIEPRGLWDGVRSGGVVVKSAGSEVTKSSVKLLTEQPNVQGDGPREALEPSEKKATEQQPDNFKDEATHEKIVEI